jgi:mono/diheme cytochrome c family protein
MTAIVRRISRHALAMCLVSSSAWPGPAQSPPSALSNANRFMTREGEVIYRTSCQGCHMAAGQGAVGAGIYPGLAANAKLRAGKFPAYVIVNGSKAMPPFRALLDDEQVAAVVNYVRSHFGNDYKDLVTVADVSSVRQ